MRNIEIHNILNILNNNVYVIIYEQGSLFFLFSIIFILLVSFYYLGPFNITNIVTVFFIEYKYYILPLYLVILLVYNLLLCSFTFFDVSLFLDNLYDNITDGNIYKESVRGMDMYKDSDNESDSNTNNVPEDVKDSSISSNNSSSSSSSSSNNNDNQDDSNKNEDNKKSNEISSKKRKLDETDDDKTVAENSNKKNKLDKSELAVSKNTENINKSNNLSDSTNLPESSNQSNSENLAQAVSENQAEGSSRVRTMPDTGYGAYPHSPDPSSYSSDSENSGEDDCGCDHEQNNSSSCAHSRVQTLSEAGGLQCCYCHGESPDGSCNSMGSHCCCVFHLSCVPRD